VVVSNLVSNAIKYTKENGAVSVHMQLRGRFCEIIVRDTGIGIPKSQQKKVFNLFYRAPEALKTGITGSGVGLVLAVDLARQIKGKINLVESSDKGSTFKFSFPFDIATEGAEAEINELEEKLDEDSTGASANIRLLFVEDEEEFRQYTSSKLREKYHVNTASDGKSALEKVNKNMPDIIITDVSMPKMNGRQLCMNLKSNLDTCHIPVILITGLTSRENVIQGFESGADAYVTKPVDFDLLFQRIDTLLENRQILKRKFLQLTDEEDFELANELDKSFIERITKYIEENISDPELSLNDLYQFSGMSRTAFYHKLKILIDISPSDFIRSIRFKKAITLLKRNRHSISEVAYLVGFSDPKYFSTSFKKYFGKSPSAFLD
jgi:DNA-binding response OmpR family regulator